MARIEHARDIIVRRNRYNEGQASIRRERFFKAGSVVATGIISFVASYFLEDLAASVLRDIGAILIGVGIIEAFFQVKFEAKVSEQVERLGGSIETLQDTVAIASGAIESGLTAVYSTRSECLAEIKSHLETIIADRKGDLGKSQNQNKSQEAIVIKILGISLGDFLCPHGYLQSIFREAIKDSRFKIDVAILVDGCNAALLRAVREEKDRFSGKVEKGFKIAELSNNKAVVKEYKSTKCHNELKTATDYLDDLIIRKRIDREMPAKDAKVHAKLNGYKYRSHPMAFILMIGDEMYVENYHLAGRGGEAPILRIARHRRDRQGDSRLFRIYEGHFQSVIEDAEEVGCSGAKTDSPPDKA